MDAQDFIVDREQHMRPLEYDLSENFNELVRYLSDAGILDNILIGTTSESEIISISDAYPAPPRALTVYGKSTQAGTPTPDAPVPILSVDDLTVHASADSGTNDYTKWPVSDLLPEGTPLRSLPDGTKDTLNLAYLRPSAREGWAWYSRELVQRTNLVTFDGSENWVRLGKQRDSGYYFAISQDSTNPLCSPGLAISTIGQLWSHYPHDNPYDASVSNGAVLWRASDWTYNNIRVSMPDGIETAADFKTWLASNNVTVQYILATPVTTTLDTIELPQLPSENAMVWCDGGSATPTLVLEYVRDANATIAELSEAIADIVSG